MEHWRTLYIYFSASARHFLARYLGLAWSMRLRLHCTLVQSVENLKKKKSVENLIV